MTRLAALAALVVALLVFAVPALAAGPPTMKAPTHVQLLAINDFHGNLQPPSGSSGRIPSATIAANGEQGAVVNADAGGVEYLSTWIKTLRTQNANTITVGAGDLIGASPLISGLFHDEPTIEAMNAIGLDVTGVGNHEFDEGVDELLRMQNGGCTSDPTTCVGGPFGGSLFQYLAANVVYAGHERHDPAALRDQAGRPGEDRLHRPDARGDAADRHARRRRRARVQAGDRDGQRARREAPQRRGHPRVRRAHPPGRAAERAVPAQVSGRESLRQLQRRHQADRRGARHRRRPRRLGAHAPAVHLQVQRDHDHERLVVRAPDHEDRPDDRPGSGSGPRRVRPERDRDAGRPEGSGRDGDHREVRRALRPDREPRRRLADRHDHS